MLNIIVVHLGEKNNNSFDKLAINTCGKRTLDYYKVLTLKRISRAEKHRERSNFSSILDLFFLYIPTLHYYSMSTM